MKRHTYKFAFTTKWGASLLESMLLFIPDTCEIKVTKGRFGFYVVSFSGTENYYKDVEHQAEWILENESRFAPKEAGE